MLEQLLFSHALRGGAKKKGADMKQYEFQLRQFEGRREYVMCTAQTVEKARAAVVDAYAPQFAVSDAPMGEYPAHYFYAEIDATA
jgi:hypothetical protein